MAGSAAELNICALNKYCYYRNGYNASHSARGLLPQILTVQRFRNNNKKHCHVDAGSYGVGVYSRAGDVYQGFDPATGLRFATAAEAQEWLDGYARRNNLVHSEREY